MKTIPFTAAHTYIAHIWQYPSPSLCLISILLPDRAKSFMRLSVTHVMTNTRKLTQAICAVAFLAALRVGEITYRGNQPGQDIISASQIAFMKTKEGTVTAIKLTLRNYKHSGSSSPVDIFIYPERPVCPAWVCSCQSI